MSGFGGGEIIEGLGLVSTPSGLLTERAVFWASRAAVRSSRLVTLE